MIIESVTSESYHDFAQALEDIGVCEALALVGGNSAVMWREESGRRQQYGEIFGDSCPLENYIVWRAYQAEGFFGGGYILFMCYESCGQMLGPEDT